MQVKVVSDSLFGWTHWSLHVRSTCWLAHNCMRDASSAYNFELERAPLANQFNTNMKSVQSKQTLGVAAHDHLDFVTCETCVVACKLQRPQCLDPNLWDSTRID